jgi:hypothetical protein
LLLTLAALVIHGYHLGVEDAEIYVPAARKLLNPKLYPYATEFFLSHGHLSLFSPILAGTAWLTHLSMDWTVLAWYVATLFGTILSCWLLAAACFASPRARWSAVLIATAVLSMPATNTALLLMDPYLTARSLSTPLTLFALASFLERRYVTLAVSVAFMATIHPQMVIYLLFLISMMWLLERYRLRGNEVDAVAEAEPVPVLASVTVLAGLGTGGLGAVRSASPMRYLAGILPTGFHLSPATGNYREALYSRDYFFLSNWSWYHWLGMLAPLAILGWFWRGRADGKDWRGTLPAFKRLSFAMVPFGLLSILVGLVFSTTHEFDMFARLQPLRCFHLITLVLILLLGGIVGEYAAKGRPWVLAAICVPLAVGMFLVGRATYPSSPQIEIPSETSSNAWVDALLWVRRNTPTDAVFAVDSRYFKDDGTDVHGFRAVSERSALADYFKDGGVVALFPDLADEWKQMSNATYGLNHFTRPDFVRLRQQYPAVTWTVIHGNAPAGLSCPYQKRGYAVCQLESGDRTSL